MSMSDDGGRTRGLAETRHVRRGLRTGRTERGREGSVGPTEYHGKRGAGSGIRRLRTVWDETCGMGGSTRRRPRDGPTSGSQKEERDIIYVVSMLVHEVKDVLLKLRNEE